MHTIRASKQAMEHFEWFIQENKKKSSLQSGNWRDYVHHEQQLHVSQESSLKQFYF